MAFDPEYVSRVLRENFEDAKAQFLPALVAIHYAHVVMLRETGIIREPDARTIRAALDALPLDAIRHASFDTACEDLFFYVERQLVRSCGEDVAGRHRIARSRNDIDMTMYRMRQRELLLSVVDAVTRLRAALIDQAARHRDTIYAAHTHTQPAQPTTVAHYLLAIIEQLERDVVRLRAAFASTNRCPMGACAITGTGFAIDRQTTSNLLGFDAPTGNTYGSIASADYLLESVSAIDVMLVGVGRVVHDLLLWCTPEFGYLRLADNLVQGSSIMPQKRNPVALEHTRALASKALGQGAAVIAAVHNTPFGDIVDTEDDLQPLVISAFRDAERAIALCTASVIGAEFDVERMRARAEAGGTTMTELADRLVRDHDLSFTTAHAIAAQFLSGDVTAVSSRYSSEELAKITSARNFVEMRRTAGGPAPEVTATAIHSSRAELDRDRAWLDEARRRLGDADARRQARASCL